MIFSRDLTIVGLRLFSLHCLTLVVIVATYFYAIYEGRTPQSAHLFLALATAAALLCFHGAILFKQKVTIERRQHLFLIANAITLSATFIFIGGSSSPFFAFLLVEIAVSAAVSRNISFIIVLIAALSYGFSFYLNPMEMSHHGNHGQDFTTHLIGMWTIFVVSGLLISLLVSMLAENIREKSTRLNHAQAYALRNEKIISLGTMAATTAHDLGTPLSSMGLLLDELNQSATKDQHAVIQMLRDMLSKCTGSLHKLTANVEQLQDTELLSISANKLVSAIVTDIQILSPAAPIEWHVKLDTDILVNADLSVIPAIINLLQNAIREAENKVVFEAIIKSHALHISIKDDGDGFSEGAINSLGKERIESESSGMGIGFLLANATIERFGGTLTAYNNVDGAVIEVVIPEKLNG